MNIVPQKTCTTCGQTKPISDFHRTKRSPDGHIGRCKDCLRIYYQTYYAANKERKIAQTSRYQREHPDVARTAQRKYKSANRDRLLPKVRARSAAWRAKNRDKDRAASRRWQQTHPDAYNAIKHRRKTRKLNAEGSYTAQEWQQLKQQYGNHCLCCHKHEPNITLTVDHVIPLDWGGSNDISNIQPLCFSCNASKSNRHATDYRLRWVPVGMAQSSLGFD